MHGAIAMIRKSEDRVREESSREIWIETKEENGTVKEYLMTHCKCCGQVAEYSKVIRFTDSEIDRWKRLQDEASHLFNMVFREPFIVLVMIIGCLMATMFMSALTGDLIINLLPVIGFFVYMVWYIKVRSPRVMSQIHSMNKQREDMIQRFGNINLNDVRLEDEYPRNFLAWPKHVIMSE